MLKPYFGKYRARVTENLDPDKLGRIQVDAPRFPSMKTAWCLPCAPYAGKGVGFYAIPPKGALVWIEFEGGNLDQPIWSGCFWADGDAPGGDDARPDVKMWKTDHITLTLDDTDKKEGGEGGNLGGLTIDVQPPCVATPLRMSFDKTGITLTCFGSDNSAKSTITLTTTGITIDHPKAKITLDDTSATITVPSAVMKMVADAITMEVDPATVEISTEGVVTTVGAATHTVKTSEIDASVGGAKAVVSATGISHSLGAMSVAVGPASVAINSEALVVT